MPVGNTGEVMIRRQTLRKVGRSVATVLPESMLDAIHRAHCHEHGGLDRTRGFMDGNERVAFKTACHGRSSRIPRGADRQLTSIRYPAR